VVGIESISTTNITIGNTGAHVPKLDGLLDVTNISNLAILHVVPSISIDHEPLICAMHGRIRKF